MQKKRESVRPLFRMLYMEIQKVSKSNIDKIQKILEEHQYIPSMSALMLAQNRSRLIGVLIGGVDGKRRSIEGDPFTSIMLSALELEIYRKLLYAVSHVEYIGRKLEVGSDVESRGFDYTWAYSRTEY